MRELVALEAVGGDWFVGALRRAWDDGDAVFPLDPRLPGPARERALSAMAPARVVHPDASPTERPGARPVDDGDALVIATSGSTGEPKGVVLTHDAVAASARATSARIGTTDDDHWLACLPLAHVGGLSVVTRALATGARLTVLTGADPAAIAAAAAHGADLVSLVPTVLRRIDPSAFRVVIVGGSRPPPDRPANCVATYGMTETGSGVVYDGVPLDGVDVRIASDGEISLRGPMLLRAYRDGSTPLDAAGWFPTGDLGRWLPDGRLHVDGRRAELIITGGENVWPEQVEAVLRAVDAVADVAVAGVDDEEWGQRVVAFVVPADRGAPPALDALRDAARRELPAFCAPREVVLVDEVPRTALGKVRRGALGVSAPRGS
jgi:O-succinylbenzoic acid--CoA ligase